MGAKHPPHRDASPDAWYTLEMSTDLFNWQTLTTGAGDGQSNSTTISLAPSRGFLRLQLDPN